MRNYDEDDAKKLVQELQDSKLALSATDTRWFRRVHGEITQYAIETMRADQFWALEDSHKAGRLSDENYCLALIAFLTYRPPI